ncbi:hypothetical protein CHCC20441_2524 [Bacillus licheniformis]|nr:hypothetical protein BKP29_0205850 [Bacillus licheniformis]TWN17726.1 hypothetical protein CHCC14564_2291 [Bacillus licheniformis LMG 17339]TWJ35646.1 hypothetical protein CHCC5026_2853 [Bacillus licheniformis]TWJ46675.1 hypothetical protein CHCC5025_0057 [Bacillus licheniformis]TWJ86154.1 hypothetical protein CHCC20496_3858 [Bacillus licheniformis]
MPISSRALLFNCFSVVSEQKVHEHTDRHCLLFFRQPLFESGHVPALLFFGYQISIYSPNSSKLPETRVNFSSSPGRLCSVYKGARDFKIGLNFLS